MPESRLTNVDRVLWIILDSVGAGALPDADLYGDVAASTLQHVAEAAGGLHLPHLAALGLGNILPVAGVAPASCPEACYGRLAERSPAKDSATGHWELAGVILERPFPTYPEGFPPEIIKAFEAAIGRETLGNKAASGTEIIQELGDEHVATGKPIVYTSVDSVFQVAAHEDVIALSELYEMCEQARKLLSGEHNIARVIARPFTGKSGAYVRLNGARRDYAVEPSGRTLLDILHAAGAPVTAVGKITDLFGGRGIDISRHTASNPETLRGILDSLDEQPRGLIMANFVDFDMVWGHRNDAAGYAQGLETLDGWIPDIRRRMRPSDVCLLTSDHGCDPTVSGTDHTREYALLLIFGEHLLRGVNLGIRASFADAGATLAELLRVDAPAAGTSFASEVLS